MVSTLTVVTRLIRSMTRRRSAKGSLYIVGMLHKPTVGCLFSGMGGFASGLSAAGFELRWANDNDTHAANTFRHRFPGVRFIPDDVQDVRAEDLETVDVLAGGFPCQSFSQAGDRKGFDDPRGEMFFQIPRLLKEWKPRDRPKLLLLENVPYLLYGAERDWIAKIRRALLDAGYWFREDYCWTINVREATGIPQDRERLFLVAASQDHFDYNPFRGISPPSTLPDSRGATVHEIVDRNTQSPKDAYLPEDNQYYKMISQEMARGQSTDNLYQLRRNYVREKKDGVCPTLTANMGLGGHNVPFVRDRWGIRRLSVAEVAQLQGFDADAALFPEAVPQVERYRLLGNAACPGLAELAALCCLDVLVECES